MKEIFLLRTANGRLEYRKQIQLRFSLVDTTSPQVFKGTVVNSNDLPKKKGDMPDLRYPRNLILINNEKFIVRKHVYRGNTIERNQFNKKKLEISFTFN